MNQTAVKVFGTFSIVSLFILTGCATQATAPAPAASTAETTVSADTSEPTMPATASESEPAPVVAAEPEPVAEPEPPKAGSVKSVVSKMEKNPFTLFWREKNSYSYFVGGKLNAEYKPGEGITVTDVADEETGITCAFTESGELSKVEGADGASPKAKDACSQLMITLDSELDE